MIIVSGSTREVDLSNCLDNKFCSRPFDYFEIGRTIETAGKTQSYLCCPAWVPVDLGDPAKTTIDEIWNSEKIQDIRKSIHDGSYKYCVKNLCPLISSNSLPDKNDVEDPYLKDIIENETTKLSKGPRTLNFSNDRSCNLTCPSCRPGKIMLTSGPEYDTMVDLHESVIEQTLKDLEWMLFSSTGDPFASKMHRKMLLSIDGKNYPDLKIQFTTNGLLLTPSMWKNLHRIHNNIESIYISVDAARPETYRQTRRDGKLEDLLPNIIFLTEERKKGTFAYIELDFVVQTLNFREMKEFVLLGKELGVDRVLFQKISDWETYENDEFKAHAVHSEEHPYNKEFMDLLKDPIFKDPIVNMGNCSQYLPE